MTLGLEVFTVGAIALIVGLVVFRVLLVRSDRRKDEENQRR